MYFFTFIQDEKSEWIDGETIEKIETVKSRVKKKYQITFRDQLKIKSGKQ